MRFAHWVLAPLFFAAPLGCGDDVAPAGSGGGGSGGGGYGAGLPLLMDDCDPLAPDYCSVPFPSDVYLVPDASTKTGKAVSFGPTTLPRAKLLESHIDWSDFGTVDGFSAGAAPMTFMPGATATGTATPVTIGRSLEEDSPTVILEVGTGRKIPHFVDIDQTGADDDRRMLMLRPVERLEDETRYVVAIRGIVDAGGEVLAPSPVFTALRDELPHEHPSVELRRGLYDQIFAELDAVGVARADLQLAWEFTTASRENNTAWLLSMRDQALATVGEEGPPYVIDTIEDDYSELIERRIVGRMTVPLFLDSPATGGRLVFGEDGLPVQTGTAEYGFTILVPRSVAAAGVPVPVVQFGHGLLGTQGQVEGHQAFADTYGYVLFAVDWIGMANDDSMGIATWLIDGEAERFQQIPDRGSQGLVNFALAMRMMVGDMASDPALELGGQSVVDPTRRYYFGESQGGIFGGTYMAISTDVQHGGLRVPGMPYSLLLNRSVDFLPFLAALSVSFPDARDQQMLIALVQMLWDRTEPNGYVPYIESDPLPGTPPHKVLLQVAIGDHQVTTLGAHLMARAIGAPLIDPPTRDVFGLEAVPPGHSGSAIVEFDFGLPPEPILNVPMEEGEDPHGKVKALAAAQAQLDAFFRTGQVEHFCTGPCDPE